MLSNCGVRTAIVTNGILASEDVIRRLYYSGLKSIQFSIDGSNDKSHDRLRNQQGVFEKVMKAIDTARKYDMEMSVACSPTTFNIGELEELHSYLSSLSFKNKMELRVQPLMPIGRGSVNMEELLPNRQMYRKLAAEINRINQSNPSIQVIWGDPIDHLIRFPNLTNLPMYYISVRANGDIVASPYLPLVVGNIRKHKFEEYWDGGLYRLIFLAINIGNEFSDRTLQASIARVRNRDRVLGAKLVVNVFCCMILTIIYPIVLTIATSIKNGWGNNFDMSILVLGTISALEIDAAMIFVCFCLELCIRISKIALIINILGIGIGMSILNSISSNVTYLADILRFTPVGYYGSCYTSGTDAANNGCFCYIYPVNFDYYTTIIF